MTHPLEVLRRVVSKGTPVTAIEPVAVRHSWDGYGFMYDDPSNGSDWLARALEKPDAEMLFTR